MPLGLRFVAIGATAFVACTSDGRSAAVGRGETPVALVRVTGSDTMVNLVQAWAERYRVVRPDVAVQVAGGGSGVGIASLIDGVVEVAAASREMTDDERRGALARHRRPMEFSVALDALAVYVHAGNELDAVSLDRLADIYGEHGTTRRWSQLGVRNPACRSGWIVRVGRQNSSGTYGYFRERVLGRDREYDLGTVDQSGSKDVVALVARTPCAIGYSGAAYATAGVKTLSLSARPGEPPVAPANDSARAGTYPLARRLYFYSADAPTGETKAFIDWVLGDEAQRLVRDLGFVPVCATGG